MLPLFTRVAKFSTPYNRMLQYRVICSSLFPFSQVEDRARIFPREELIVPKRVRKAELNNIIFCYYLATCINECKETGTCNYINFKIHIGTRP